MWICKFSCQLGNVISEMRMTSRVADYRELKDDISSFPKASMLISIGVTSLPGSPDTLRHRTLPPRFILHHRLAPISI
jgi:hypothetical protein